MHRPVSLSIVIPCHNEAEVITDTHRTLKGLADQLAGESLITDYEFVLVNNGSTDNTLEKMLELLHCDPHVRILDLRKNYGYQGSITAGIYHASMEMIVSIDADLQDDPEKIREMIEKYYEGFELVLGIRSGRKTDTFFKKWSAGIYYRILNGIGVQSVYNHGDFRLLSRRLVDEFKQFGERNRYIRGMIFELESRYACVYYERRKREKGKSKFRLVHLTALGLDGITSFSNWPIRLVFFIGLLMFILSLAGIVSTLLLKFLFGVKVSGWASTVIIIFLVSGIQNLLLGMVGEYIAKIYFEVKQRPLFLVRKIYELNKKKNRKK